LAELSKPAPSVEESHLGVTSGTPLSSVNMPASPSNFELTDAVLRKSEFLLKELSDLGLESIGNPCTQDTQDIESNSGCSSVSSHMASESKPTGGLETVEVPVVFLKMLSEKWDEVRSNGSTLDVGSLSLAMSDSLASIEARKEHPCSFSPRSSSTSIASTAPPLEEEEDIYDSPADSPSGTPPVSSARLFSGPWVPNRSHAPLVASSVHAPSLRASYHATAPPRGVATICATSPQAGTPIQEVGVCRRRSMSLTPGSQTITVTASVPPGSSVKIAVTTAQTMQRTQSVCTLASTWTC